MCTCVFVYWIKTPQSVIETSKNNQFHIKQIESEYMSSYIIKDQNFRFVSC